jgi:hypothetical protein
MCADLVESRYLLDNSSLFRDRRRSKKDEQPFNAEALLNSVETVFGLKRDKFCGAVKAAQAVMAKEVLILTGRDAGATITELSGIVDLDTFDRQPKI